MSIALPRVGDTLCTKWCSPDHVHLFELDEETATAVVVYRDENTDRIRSIKVTHDELAGMTIHPDDDPLGRILQAIRAEYTAGTLGQDSDGPTLLELLEADPVSASADNDCDGDALSDQGRSPASPDNVCRSCLGRGDDHGDLCPARSDQ